jgi:hypothetical protein
VNSARGSSSLENELEDSLIGNDVLVEETKQQSKQLLAHFKPILGTDRHGGSCVILETPEKLLQFGINSGISATQLTSMAGPICAQLKPYQAAALCYLSTLMRLGARGCSIATERGLGARALLAVWAVILKRSNSHPLRVVPGCTCPRTHAAHCVAAIVTPPEKLPKWRTALAKWASGLRVAEIVHARSSSGDATDAARRQMRAFAKSLAAPDTIGGEGRAVQDRCDASTEQGEAASDCSSSEDPLEAPFDVALVAAPAAADAGVMRELAWLPWLAVYVEGVPEMSRESFKGLRPLLAQAHQRVALVKGSICGEAAAADVLRSLTELVQPRVFDARQGHQLSMVHCASTSAEAVSPALSLSACVATQERCCLF